MDQPIDSGMIPTLHQIKKAAKDKEQLQTWRNFLMDNVQRLVVENHIEWKNWELLMSHIDLYLNDVPLFMLIPPRPGEMKGIKV